MVTEIELETIGRAFGIKTPFKKHEALTSGHINDTYLVTQWNDEKYIVQRLNHLVFPNIHAVMANKVLVSTHLQKQYAHAASPYQAVSFLKTTQNAYVYFYKNTYWNVMLYIPNAVTIQTTKNPDITQEAGKLYGDFIFRTSGIKISSLDVTLPKFHDVSWRFTQFNTALEQANNQRKKQAQETINFAQTHVVAMQKIEQLQAHNKIPIRITHNDTKLTNILFNANYKGLAVIDLDTVMPGSVLFDFGDSVRSICATTTEDDPNEAGTHINLELYSAFCTGFASQVNTLLTPTEKANLVLGVQTLIYIMGLRFVTDFLNNDTYYKTRYENHNLDRANNQFALLKSVFAQVEAMERITQKHFR
ncbi:phosphotransferase enzyme family protein [Bizionia sediminis]|uniref:Phosphotransferase enzyme family protein n=1 Tax=Bizionia sediminis TaxID=1737064 RepID=A0ABW5KQP7_9FLAO